MKELILISSPLVSEKTNSKLESNNYLGKNLSYVENVFTFKNEIPQLFIWMNRIGIQLSNMLYHKGPITRRN